MPAEDDYKRFSEFADELGLEDEDRDKFINSAMKRKGYNPRMAWDDPEPQNDGDNDDGDFFSQKRKEKQKQPDQQQQKKASGGGWQYE